MLKYTIKHQIWDPISVKHVQYYITKYKVVMNMLIELHPAILSTTISKIKSEIKNRIHPCSKENNLTA